MQLWTEYFAPENLQAALQDLADGAPAARIVAGGTDLILELERGLRPGVRRLIDITRIAGLDEIELDDAGWVHLGPLVSHNHCAASPLLQTRAGCLAHACWEVGAPQIRNRGTIAGNLITASPANDSITPLMALGAVVTLQSVSGERTVPLSEFYLGVRETVMRPDEMMSRISFPLPPDSTRTAFHKLGLRRAQAISIVNVAVVVDMDGDRVRTAAISLGAVAPTIVQAEQASASLENQTMSDSAIRNAAKLAAEAATPIDDVRGSRAYRQQMVEMATIRALHQVAAGAVQAGPPEDPVMLWGAGEYHWRQPMAESFQHDLKAPIEATINGQSYSLHGGQDKTLLRLLREDAGLIGTKEGCAEGECGACTVFLDGAAVMSCLVPGPRAHGADIVTVEGLQQDGKLHPVQQAFVETGAVQCGYCTPGFIMSGVKLLEERPTPNRWEAQQAITGNLCRCTGYYSILAALELAGKKAAAGGRPAAP